MYENKFTDWLTWETRNTASNVRYPGIYILAISDANISDSAFTWIPEIVYVGMTNSIAGLRGRLKQFDYTIVGKRGHGGADRFRYKYQDYPELIQKLFVAVSPFQCDVKSNKPDDLKIMGLVAKFEYDCFAEFVKQFGELPEFNNKKKSPKYSLTFGKKEKI